LDPFSNRGSPFKKHPKTYKGDFPKNFYKYFFTLLPIQILFRGLTPLFTPKTPQGEGGYGTPYREGGTPKGVYGGVFTSPHHIGGWWS